MREVSIEAITESLSRNIIDRDAKFMVLEKGRKRTQVAFGEKITPAKDPFLSHLCYYGFEGNAPTEEYKQMWKEIVQSLKDQAKAGMLTSVDRDNIRSIVKIYEEKHPGKKIDISFLEEK